MLPRKTLIIIILTFAALIVGILVVYALIPRATLKFSVAPENVTVTINGENHSVTTGQTISVAPGEIELKINRKDFLEHTETFTLENNQTREILVALTPTTDEARMLLDAAAARAVVERLGGQEVDKGADELMKEYPILAKLPITDKFFRIVICNSKKYPDDPKKLAVCIRLFEPEARQAAFDEIERQGFSLKDYEIIVQAYDYETMREQAGE